MKNQAAMHLNRYASNLAQSSRLYIEIDNFLWNKQISDGLSITDVIRKRAELFTAELFCPEKSAEFFAIMQKAFSSFAEMIPDDADVLKAISKKYLLFAASNGNIEVQTARLKRADIFKYYTSLFISDDIGFEKPDKRFFEEALKRSGVSKNEVLMVGDNLCYDIKGAHDSGIDPCWFRRSGTDKKCNKAKFVITDLKELTNLI